MRRLFVGIALFVGLLAACSGADEKTASQKRCKPDSPDAAWLRKVARVAGLRIGGCTRRAWIVEGRTTFELWTRSARPAGMRVRYARLAGVRIYGSGKQLAWTADGSTVLLQRDAAMFPPTSELAELIFVTQRLPRRYRPVEIMATPWGPLQKCRSSLLLRRICPRVLPRIPGWLTYPRYGNPVDTTFGIEYGGEYPGKPELNRPPALVHVEIAAGHAGTNVASEWRSNELVRPRNGLLRVARKDALSLGRVRWGGRAGEILLAPPFPTGGSLGNHLVFRWRERRVEYLVTLHAWEPFLETVRTLRTMVESIPRD